jgi:hypothetical protein
MKRMSEQSGCRYQLGEENDPYNTNERIVTITGTASPSVVNGAISIMHQLLDEPRVRTYSNPTTNYFGRGGTPHSQSAQNMPHMMNSPPPTQMMPSHGFVPYGAVTSFMPVQYGMGQMQIPMQQAMYAHGMHAGGYPMHAAQYPMGAAPGYPGPSPMYGQYSPGQHPPMDMNQAYQQQQSQQQYGVKAMYAPQGGMPIPQQFQQQVVHQQQQQQGQLGVNNYNGANSHNTGKMK